MTRGLIPGKFAGRIRAIWKRATVGPGIQKSEAGIARMEAIGLRLVSV